MVELLMSIISKKIEFKVNAGSLLFHIKKVYPDEAVIVFEVVNQLESKFKSFFPKIFTATFYSDDLSRLADYFDRQRVSLFKDNKVSIDPYNTFVTLDMEFQISVVGGLYYDSEDIDDSKNVGQLNVLFLIDCGISSSENAERSYFGFESSIEFIDLDKFCNTIREINDTYRCFPLEED